MSRPHSPSSPILAPDSSSHGARIRQILLESLRYTITTLRRSVSLPPSTPRGQPLKPTAWLDGLRGFAALLVYFHHHQLWVHNPMNRSRFFEEAYGHEGHRYFGALPGIRLFFGGGHFAVAAFFVISGYVLSCKPLALIHAGDMERLAENMSSALFRRWIRLFLPVAATTFLWLTSWHAFGTWCAPFVPQDTYAGEVAKWFKDFKQYSFHYKSDKLPGAAPWIYYNLHTWSIPFEFRGSLTVYAVLLAVSMCTRQSRMLVVGGLIASCLLLVDGWYLAMFLAGTLLCDIDLQAAKKRAAGLLPSRRSGAEHCLWTTLFVVAIWLGSVPNNKTPELKKAHGWGTLAYLVPSASQDAKWFFLFWAAVLLVASVPRLPAVRTLFETRFAQYLGRVSYSMYLVHGPMIWTLGYVVDLVLGWPNSNFDIGQYPWFYNTLDISKEGPMGLEPAFWVGQLVLLPATLFVANVVTLTIDEPSVSFAAWVRRKALPQKGQQSSTMEIAGVPISYKAVLKEKISFAY